VEFLVDERNQLRQRRLVALPPGQKQAGDRCGMIFDAVILGFFRRVHVFPTVSRFLH
jgi:hypothetical protein